MICWKQEHYKKYKYLIPSCRWAMGVHKCTVDTYVSISITIIIVCNFKYTMQFHMLKCLGNHSCMSKPFHIAIVNGACFFRDTRWSFRLKIRLSKTNNNINFFCCATNIFIEVYWTLFSHDSEYFRLKKSVLPLTS